LAVDKVIAAINSYSGSPNADLWWSVLLNQVHFAWSINL